MTVSTQEKWVVQRSDGAYYWAESASGIWWSMSRSRAAEFEDGERAAGLVGDLTRRAEEHDLRYSYEAVPA